MEETNNTQSIADYLAQLLKDKKQLTAFPNVFLHLERLLDEEIARIRGNLFQINGVKKEPLVLPEPTGDSVSLSEKVFVPVKDHPEFNFVGRILGPRGMTAKQLEMETGCKIMVRGKGSMRDKKKEELNRGKSNWEHLNEDLHVLITVEDTENRAILKLQRAVEEVRKLLIPVADGEDELKKRQLMELAIINGTYRDSNHSMCNNDHTIYINEVEAQRMLQSAGLSGLAATLRTTTGAPLGSLGTPVILSSRISMPTCTTTSLIGGSAPPPLIAPPEASLIYTPYSAPTATDYTTYATLTSPLLTAAEYTTDHAGGLFAR